MWEARPLSTEAERQKAYIRSLLPFIACERLGPSSYFWVAFSSPLADSKPFLSGSRSLLRVPGFFKDSGGCSFR